MPSVHDSYTTNWLLQNCENALHIKSSSTSHGAYVFDKSELSIVNFWTSRNVPVPNECSHYLSCKFVVGACYTWGGRFAEYYTRDFALAALEKILATLNSGIKEMEIPKDGLFEPFKVFYKGKIIPSWEVPATIRPNAHEFSLFDD